MQVSRSAASVPALGGNPADVPAGLASAHPRAGPVRLRKDQSLFPGRAGGSSGEIASGEAPSGRRDPSELCQRMAGPDSLQQNLRGRRHRTKILERSAGSPVS